MVIATPLFHDASFGALGASLFDPVALAIVCGGTALAMLLRTPLVDLLRSLRALTTLWRRPWRADPALAQLAALGRIAGRHGVVTLDRSVIRDPDLAMGVAAIVDGTDPETIAERFNAAQDARTERHLAVIETWTAMAEIAPAMGMIGTLIGLVRMFMVMTDPGAIGGAMAVALLTTLYGALIASMVAMPIAARLRRAARIEAAERARLDAPLFALARREAPRVHRVAA